MGGGSHRERRIVDEEPVQQSRARSKPRPRISFPRDTPRVSGYQSAVTRASRIDGGFW